MKCVRCGEECKDSQKFCLKCGNSLQKRNLSNTLDFLDDEFYVDAMPEHDVEAELSLLDIQEIEEEERKEREMKIAAENARERARRSDGNFEVDGIGFGGRAPKIPEDEEEDARSKNDVKVKAEKKMFKIKAVIFSIIGVIVIAIVFILMTVVNPGESGSKSFSKVYNEGYDYYASKNYDDALKKFKSAKELAEKDNDIIKVNKSLLATYENIEGTNEEQIKILKELIELDPEENEYYTKLVSIYYENDMEGEIADLIESIEDVSLKSDLSEYSVTSPKFSEEEGEYDTYISVRLTSSSKDIYYTLDGSEPTTESTKYKDPIKIDKAGETTISAISVNDKGLISKVSTATYKISPSEIEGPVITPGGGVFNETTEITVEIPEGMKCYYTYGNAEVMPTLSDKEYTEPVKMLRGKNYFIAILVAEDGTVSEPTKNIYQLNLTSTVSYDEALSTVQNYLTENNLATKLNDEEYLKSDGMLINFSYNSIASIEGGEYYVINASEKDSKGSVKNIVYYGVETFYGTLEILEKDSANGGFKFIETPEESEN